MSDFARPPKKPPRAGNGTLGQTNCLRRMVELRKQSENRNEKQEKKHAVYRKRDSFSDIFGIFRDLQDSAHFCTAPNSKHQQNVQCWSKLWDFSNEFFVFKNFRLRFVDVRIDFDVISSRIQRFFRTEFLDFFAKVFRLLGNLAIISF